MGAEKWKPDIETVVLRTRISRAAKVHMGHVGWFDSSDPPREEDAARYWARECPPDWPDLWEYVVDGFVYFPDWRDLPFGRFGGGAPETGASQTLGPAEAVACPVCRILFEVRAPNAVTFTSADRYHCREDPDLPMLCDCKNVMPSIEAAWDRLKQQS